MDRSRRISITENSIINKRTIRSTNIKKDQRTKDENMDTSKNEKTICFIQRSDDNKKRKKKNKLNPLRVRLRSLSLRSRNCASLKRAHFDTSSPLLEARARARAYAREKQTDHDAVYKNIKECNRNVRRETPDPGSWVIVSGKRVKQFFICNVQTPRKISYTCKIFCSRRYAPLLRGDTPHSCPPLLLHREIAIGSTGDGVRRCRRSGARRRQNFRFYLPTCFKENAEFTDHITNDKKKLSVKTQIQISLSRPFLKFSADRSSGRFFRFGGKFELNSRFARKRRISTFLL